MKIVNNRYQMDKSLYHNFFVEAYRVKDLQEDGKFKFIKIYHYNLQTNLIDYFVSHYLSIKNIKHENILGSEEFNLIKTMDGVDVNSSMYFSVSEYIEYTTLFETIDDFNFSERIKIFLDMIMVVQFLHFRGLTYKFLNPLQIVTLADKTIKLQNISSIIEKTYHNEYSEFERRFLSPAYISKNKEDDKNFDYYSLARMMEYLFFEDGSIFDSLEAQQSEETIKAFLHQIKTDFENRDFKLKDLNLGEYVQKIIDFFQLDYAYDLVKERGYLSLDNQMVGRDHEMAKLLSLDETMVKNASKTHVVTLAGKSGMGKSKFLEEISYRLELKGRGIFSTKIKTTTDDEIIGFAEFFIHAMNELSPSFKEKYSKELEETLLALREDLEVEKEEQGQRKWRRYRVFNRMVSYVKELSENKLIYVLIDDIQNCSPNFMALLDYFLRNVAHSNMVCVLAYDSDEMDKNYDAKEGMDQWKEDLDPLEIQLNRLDLENTGELVKEILGMGYIHWAFSTILFKESDGKPQKVQELLAYLFHDGQLYMGKNGKWVLNIDHISDIYLPNRIKQHTLNELEAMEKSSYEILKIISIFNDLLPKDVLVEMVKEEENLDLMLDQLRTRKWIETKVADWGYSYTLSNVDVKKHVYFSMEQMEKENLHKRAAMAIEKLDARLLGDFFEELVFHFIKSKNQERALEIILKKLETVDNKSGSQASYLLEKAYGLFKQDTPSSLKLEVLDQMLYIALLKRELEEEDPKLQEYTELAHRVHSKYHKLNVMRIKAEIYYFSGREEAFLEQVEEMKVKNKAYGLVEFETYIITVLANYDVDLGELEKAEKELLRALELAIAHNLGDQLGNICNILGVIHYLSGRHNEATEFFEKSYGYFREDRDIMRSVKPINNLGNIYVAHLNDAKKALDYYLKGLDISETFGLTNMQFIFCANISELKKENYEYDEALKYVIQGNQLAVEMQDSKKIGICQCLLGSLYLGREDYDKAYDCYTYVQSVATEDRLKDLEFSLTYCDFMGGFYFAFGDWDEAIAHYNTARDLYAKIDLGQYYRFQFRAMVVEFFKDHRFNKPKLEQFLKEYKATIYVEDYRQTVLMVALFSVSIDDKSYAKQFLAHDLDIKQEAEIPYLNKLRAQIQVAMNLNQSNIEQLRINLGKDFEQEHFPVKSVMMAIMAMALERQGNLEEALRCYMEILEKTYKNIMVIPTWDLKIAFIKSRSTDDVKESIQRILFNAYGYAIDVMPMDALGREENPQGLNEYFNYEKIIETMGKAQFVSMSKIQSYGRAIELSSLESLLRLLGGEYQENLDLILKYLAKETLATDGFIVDYHKDSDTYEVVASLNEREGLKDQGIHHGILKLASRTQTGLLMGANLDDSTHKVYKNFLSDEVIGVICVPLILHPNSSEKANEQRADPKIYSSIMGYIYLETRRGFHNFTEEALKLVNSMAYLVYTNLEINKLALMATTDKMTGAFTRKYYEEKFNELMEYSKATNPMFFVLMLDLDKFKEINDTYGHRKGDEVLKEVGAVIKSSIRTHDIFGRYGGEEFIVVLKDIPKDAALAAAERIRKTVEKIKIEGIKKPITLSIGISFYPSHSKYGEDLIEKADQALYHAKQTGRNRVSVWNSNMDGIFERVDKLAGILTGASETDTNNMLGMVEIIALVGEFKTFEQKVLKYLAEILHRVHAHIATLLVLGQKDQTYSTSDKFHEQFTETPVLNEKIIQEAITSKKGQYLIDWENLGDQDEISKVPNFNSIMVVPMIQNGEVKGITYVSIPLNQREFDFNDFNLVKNYAGIFASLL